MPYHDNPDLRDVPPGTFCILYEIRTKRGKGKEFSDAFHAWDYGGENPFHTSPDQVKEGILYRDRTDPDRFVLVAWWKGDSHPPMLAKLRENPPPWMALAEGPVTPQYLDIVG
jgi:hypothetical protein